MMRRAACRRFVEQSLWIVPVVAAAWLAGAAAAAEITLKDGRILQGKLAAVSSLSDQPAPPDADGAGQLQLIIVLDDDLRRIFVSKRQIQQVNQAAIATTVERFKIWQKKRDAGLTVKSVGPVIRIQPFDEYGRRTFTFNTSGGPVDVIQGITEITPQWTRVDGLSHVWDMRIATSSIPPATLQKILTKQTEANNLDHQKKIANFYMQCEHFDEAAAQLQAILKKQPNLQHDLEPTIQQLRQMAAQRLLNELKLRRQAGQHHLVRDKLKTFPTTGVAGEILQAVAEMLDSYDKAETRRKETIEWLDAEIAKIDDHDLRGRIAPARDEIAKDLAFETLPRMAAFRQNADDRQLLPAEKVALAISGWLLGSDAAVVKLPVALSAFKVRGLIRQYLNAADKVDRDQVFRYFSGEEAGTPGMVAALLANMTPPWDPPAPVDAQKQPGYYELEVTTLPNEPKTTYYVQLPPEYDPYRHYPAIVTLNGSGTTAPQQVDWWAGDWAPGGWRAGQATRQGYIVVAPAWTTEHQKHYNYSAREHAAVLFTLRDACRRFSIDTDRVFLSGHSIGGDAAWDIALAHPDLWAGVIPIVAQADKFVALYWRNAERLPMYFIGGELDGGKMKANTRDLDRYLKLGYNCTVVEYQGRGHEHFYDEILRLFDWMGRFHRDFFPREFTVKTMRTWDNYFWWLELNGMPSGSMVEPAQWPPRRGAQPVEVKGSINSANGINVTTGSSQVTVWISPRMLSFEQRANIVVDGRRLNSNDRFLQPDLRTILEDVRTRGDRQNPFWARVDMATGRL